MLVCVWLWYNKQIFKNIEHSRNDQPLKMEEKQKLARSKANLICLDHKHTSYQNENAQLIWEFKLK